VKPKVTSFIPAVIWFIVIFILLVMPNNDIPSNNFFDLIHFDKLVHGGIFGLLVWLTSFPFFKTNYVSLSLFIKITLGAILYGVAMEFVQKYLTTDRDYDILDMVADSVGAILACIFINLIYKRWAKKHKAI
jgi:VanZ family protein